MGPGEVRQQMVILNWVVRTPGDSDDYAQFGWKSEQTEGL